MRKKLIFLTATLTCNIFISIYIYEHLITYSWNPDKTCLAGQMNYSKKYSNSILWNWIF
jgi:hypothetical protein